MKRYDNGVTFDEMVEVGVGDIIWLADKEVSLIVQEKGPSVRRGDRPGQEVQRSAFVKIGQGSQGLPELHNRSSVILMVTNDTPPRITVAPF
jgi:hypothetical protein